MTLGRNPGRKKTDRRQAPGAFPHLRAFLSGYLHQDFLIDYASASDALRAFLAEANADERQALREEWGAFRDAMAHADWKEVRTLLAELGSAWRPVNRRALEQLFAALSSGGD